MVAPGATGADFDVLLQFSMDEEANKRVQQRVSTIEQELKRLQQEAQNAGKAMNTMAAGTANAAQAAAKQIRLTWTEFIKQNMGPEMKAAMQAGLSHAEAHKVAITKIAEAWKQYKAEGVTALKTVQAADAKAAQEDKKRFGIVGAELARLTNRAKESSTSINDAVSSSVRKYAELEESAKRVRQQAALISGAAARGAQISSGLLLSGLGVAGGIVAEAGRFAKDLEMSKKGTELTRAWAQATEDLGRARARVDNVLLRESLPLLQQATRIASQAADFIEKHPEIVQAALKTGVVVAGLGAVGLAVSKGIKLVADIAYITAVATELVAAKLHNTAADKELAAAAAKNITNRADDLRAALGVGKTGGLAGGGGLAAAITSPVGIAALVAANAVAVNEAAKNLNLLEDAAVKFVETTGRGSQFLVPIFGNLRGVLMTIAPIVPTIQILRRNLEKDMPAVLKWLGLGQKAAPGSTGTTGPNPLEAANSPQFESILKAYEDYKADDLALVQEHYADRNKIINDALASEKKANENYAASVTKIRTQTSESLASAAADFNKANAQAEQDYQQQRADIIRDGNRDVQQLQKDLQERLRKNEQEHAERSEDLTAARDALGLAKENRRFREQQDETRREGLQEIKQRRADIAQRLADLQQSYEQERAQRAADYQERVLEIQANARQQLAELQAQHQAELREIQAQKVARIREIDAQFVEERKRRYQQLIQTLRDLDAGLLGESKLRKQYQDLMMQDLNAFLTRYRAGLATIGGTTGTTVPKVPVHDYSGYAYPGVYQMANNGQREFVLSGAATKAAERAIGGSLNQEMLLRALGAIGGRQATYIDQRRLDQPLPKDAKALYQKMAEEALMKAIGG